jgi:RNA polymerase sigma-70 factor, ECF subfamily
MVVPCTAALTATEGPLVLRLKQGEHAAVADLYDRYHAQVRAFARRFTGNDAHAEDLVQEVFIALPKAIHSFEERAKLSTFLLSMTYNLGRRHVRTAARHRAMQKRYEREPQSLTVDGEREFSNSELARQLLAALDTLPADQRAAFTLMELEDYSSAEVAEIVGAPEGTIRTRLFHAKRKLREQLESYRSA